MTSRILALAYRNGIIAKRNVFAVIEMVFWPIIGILSIGLMGDFLVLDERLMSFVLTGAVVSGVLQVAQLDVAYGLVYDLWSKSLKHMFLTPITLLEFAVGAWLIGIVRGLIIFAILALCGWKFFGFALPGIVMTATLLFGVMLTALLIGLCVWVLILSFGHRAEISTWALAPLFLLLSGLYYPIEYLPSALHIVAKLLPLTYVMEGFRASYGFPASDYWFLKMLALSAFYGVLVMWFLGIAVKRARVKGTIVRLSE